MIPRRFGQWVRDFRYEIKPLDGRLRFSASGEEVQQFYLIKDIFTIRDGTWVDDGQAVGSVETWARDQYLQEWQDAFMHEDVGDYPHIFTRVETPQGLPIRNKAVFAWRDRYDRIFEQDFDQVLDVELEPTSGWGRLELNSSAMYNPVLEQGPWCIKPLGFAESIEGVGLPRMLGISSFIVWMELPIEAFDNVAAAPMPQADAQPDLTSEFQRRLSEMARINQLIYFNPDATIQRKIIEDGFVPNSGEFEMEFNQSRFVAQLAQNLKNGALRVYFVKRNFWHQVQWIPLDPTYPA